MVRNLSIWLVFFHGYNVMLMREWKIRYAALLMIVNFMVALLMVHRGQSLEVMTTPLLLLFIFFSSSFKMPARSVKKNYSERGNSANPVQLNCYV